MTGIEPVPDEVLPQAFAICAKPAQVPEYIAAAVVLVALEIRTEWVEAVATNEYQTSSLLPVPLQEGTGVEDWVPPTVVPETGLLHEVVEEGAGKATDPAQSSLAGGAGAAVIQKLNVPLLGDEPTHRRSV